MPKSLSKKASSFCANIAKWVIGWLLGEEIPRTKDIENEVPRNYYFSLYSGLCIRFRCISWWHSLLKRGTGVIEVSSWYLNVFFSTSNYLHKNDSYLPSRRTIVCVMFCRSLFVLLSFCPFSPGYCFVFLFSIYGFWLPF